MYFRNVVVSILIGLFFVSAASLVAGAQIYVNQPYNAAQPGYITPPASMVPDVAANAAASAAFNAAPYANFAQQPYTYAAPYVGDLACEPVAAAPYAAPLDVPFEAVPYSPVVTPYVAPVDVEPYGPFTAGFTYSAQRASAFDPFTPPVTQASEQFYQYPGLTPYGPYPGAGYSAAGGVGFDPVTGYYGPYGAATPL